MDTKYIIILTTVAFIVLTGFTYLSYFFIPHEWVNFLVGSILFGTFFGSLKSSINGEEPNFNLTFILVITYLFWFFLTKIISKLVSEEKTIDAIQDEQNKLDEKSIENKKENGSKYIYPIVLVIIFISLTLFLKYSFLPISFFLFISIIFTYLTNNRLNNIERIQIISYTISFGIIFGIFAPLFLFENFKFKNSITNTLIFFSWLSLTQATSKFLTPST